MNRSVFRRLAAALVTIWSECARRCPLRAQTIPYFLSACLMATNFHIAGFVPYAILLLSTLAFDYVMFRAGSDRLESANKKSDQIQKRRKMPCMERLLFLGVISLVIAAMGSIWTEKERRVSVVIPSRFEAAYVVKTVKYVYETTPMSMLHEVILVDDQSPVLIRPLIQEALKPGGELHWLSRAQRRALIILRNEREHEGLIRAKIQGANFASGNYIFFLDAHCRPTPRYMEEMMDSLDQGSYKRIVVPRVTNTNATTWINAPGGGVKMMFVWDFSFHWYDDKLDEVPIMSGGLLLMTKKLWNEGGLDDGMLDWGGENIEQSIRTWLCGGEIFVARNSVVGHIFDRPANPTKVRPGGVRRNHARASFAWLDDYASVHSAAGGLGIEAIDTIGNLDKQLLRRRTDSCKPFSYYMQLFRHTFELRGLFVQNMHHIQDVASGLCFEAEGSKAHAAKASPLGSVSLQTCKPGSTKQRWSIVADGKRVLNQYTALCLDAGGRKMDGTLMPILYACAYGEDEYNLNQSWKFVGSPMPLIRSNTISSHRGAIGYFAQIPGGAKNKGIQPIRPARERQTLTLAGCIGEKGVLAPCSMRGMVEWIW